MGFSQQVVFNNASSETLSSSNLVLVQLNDLKIINVFNQS